MDFINSTEGKVASRYKDYLESLKVTIDEINCIAEDMVDGMYNPKERYKITIWDRIKAWWRCLLYS